MVNMVRTLTAFFLVAFVFSGCSNAPGNKSTDTIPAGVPAESVSTVQTPFQLVYARTSASVDTLAYPAWITVDSIFNYKVAVTHEDAALLFPKGFEIPNEVSLNAFGKSQIDSTTHGIWYSMELHTGDGPPNMDIWMVLYNDTAGAVAAHCFATRGVGSGFAKSDSVNVFREVLVKIDDKTVVTTKMVRIKNAHFVIEEEKTSTFGPQIQEQAKSKAYIENFLK
jgi:hypothetical protein